MLGQNQYRFDPGGRETMSAYIEARRALPHFANARSIRNALDRARLRQANRLFESGVPVDVEALSTLRAEDIRASRVFAGGLAHERGA
jgi:hypothetical protein